MNISLPPELESMVNEIVNSGLYNSPTEAIREGLRLLKEQEQFNRFRHAELRREILSAKQAFDEGDYKTYKSAEELVEGIINDGLEKLNARKLNGK